MAHETHDFWWVFPLAVMALCFLFMMMRGRRGSMMCGWYPQRGESRFMRRPDSAMDILDKRYAGGEIEQKEYEEKKKELMRSEGGS